MPLIVTLLEMVTSPTLSTAENIGTVTEMGPESTFSAPTTLKLGNRRFSISSTWAATFRSTPIVGIGQYAEYATRIVTSPTQHLLTAPTSQNLIAQIWRMAIIPTSITAGSTGIALGAKVNMFCVLQRTKAMERKIFSTMLRE